MSFYHSVELMFDAGMTLTYGETPDFERYRAQLNAILNKDSVVIGQEREWLTKEADKENKRLDNDWRHKSDYRHKIFKPYGNDGPGLIAKMHNWKPKSRVATFSWNRERLTEPNYHSYNVIFTQISVSANALFNVSAYQPGDYKQFFKDPRSRAEYLVWHLYSLQRKNITPAIERLKIQ